MKNNKVMFVANDTTFIYKLRKEIIEEFTNNGYDVVVVAKRLKFTKEIEKIGCKIVNLSLNRTGTNPFSDFRLLNHIYEILKDEKPGIVYTNSIKPNVYFGIACNKLKIPFVPNITGLGRALEYPGLLQKISIFLYRLGMKGANTILFQNEFNKNFFIDNSIIDGMKKYVILPGSGVNTNEYQKLDYPESQTFTFLFISRIRVEKGIDYFINSAKALNEKYNNLKFNVCGLCEDDNYLKKFKNLEKDGHFKYYGEQEDLTPFYNSASCIVHPTYYPEGMSNVLLEACSHARPIITTDRPGCREIVDDGYNGYMIETRNQEQLDSALEKFINLSYEDKLKMGLNGRKKIEKQFDRKLVVNKYMELTAEILDN